MTLFATIPILRFLRPVAKGRGRRLLGVLSVRQRGVRACVAATLALLWLPITSHCALEAAGVIAASCCCGESDSEPANQSGCREIESQLIHQGSESELLKLPQPTAVVVAVLPEAVDFSLRGFAPSELHTGLPPPSRECWAFKARALPPAQAP